mmetsp:Transcript_13662/g.24490  ORF Transcript_13662/g.24490 Transcript_13662/m.24490 type:complete len:388 (-) Transcript_13662:649-1812(-)
MAFVLCLGTSSSSSWRTSSSRLNTICMTAATASSVSSTTLSQDSSNLVKMSKSASKFERMRAKFGTREQTQTIDTGFSYEDFESEIIKYEKSTAMGDLVVGTVVQLDKGGTFVDIGAKSSALLPLREMSMLDVDKAEDVVTVGDQREFEVISSEDAMGMLTLSLKRMEFRKCWERLAQLQAEDVTVNVSIDGYNRGGVTVTVENIRGFIPGSHLATPITPELVGTEVPAKFIEVDSEKGRVVLSNRRAAVQTQISDLESGSVVEGVVRSVKPYGVFVDVGGLTGLLHISQISHDRVEDPGKVLEFGSKIKCMVINADKERGRVSLSTKTLEPEPGDMLKNAQMVYEKADEMAERYHKRLEEERKAAVDVADDIVSSLDIASLDDLSK